MLCATTRRYATTGAGLTKGVFPRTAPATVLLHTPNSFESVPRWWTECRIGTLELSV